MAAADVKERKHDVDYGAGHSGSRCGLCRYYSEEYGEGSCEKVAGAIQPHMWCRLFKKAGKRTLYVMRPLVNGDEVRSWAAGQGFETALPADDMHVTIAFSRQKLLWPSALGTTISVAGGKRSVAALGELKDAIVLKFPSKTLRDRWQQLRDAGASWDWPGYEPHITITYRLPPGIQLDAIEPYTGPLEFGPEQFSELDEDWKDDVAETKVAPENKKIVFKGKKSRMQVLRERGMISDKAAKKVANAARK